MKFTSLTFAALALPILPLLGGTPTAIPAVRSAHLSTEAHSAYLTAVKQQIGINFLGQGPFGLPQDASAGTIDPDDVIRPTEPPAPLATLLKKMKITAINPGEQTFLVGARIFHEAETFPLLDNDRELQVKVESVAAGKVIFRDLESGQRARISLEIAPVPRPQQGAGNHFPPGIEPAPLKGEKGLPFRLR